MQKTKPILYKIYYGDTLVYLGRTKQPLRSRLHGHFFQKPMHRIIDINQVTKIEYAEFKTVADMYLYEIYFINRLKPCLNVDDLAKDEITVTLPEVDFTEYICPLMDTWKEKINAQNSEFEQLQTEYRTIPLQRSLLRRKRRDQEISEDEYWSQYDILRQREKELYKQLFGREKTL